LKAVPVKTRISRTRTEPLAAFTLLETVVVLTIVGVIAALAVPYYSRAAARQQVDAAAHELARTLEAARTTAVAEKRTVPVSFETAPAVYRSAAGTHILPDTFSLSLEHGNTLNFYADGSADPGVIRLTANRHQATVEVDQLTGLARVGQ
jgi:prepilin-type N-terminal cleavage/methylation domain-containing protein